MRWIAKATEILSAAPACIRVVVAEARGSAPREAGASILVGADVVLGTIGGGALEFRAIGTARGMLAEGADRPRFETIPLGPGLGQCCGGQVTLCFQPLDRAVLERIATTGGGSAHLVTTRDSMSPEHLGDGHAARLGELGAPRLAARRLAAGAKPELLKTGGAPMLVEPPQPARARLCLFGAGHVGREIVHVLGRHDLDIDWIDPRRDEFPLSFPANTRIFTPDDPVRHVASGDAGCDWLVMTHDHALDLALVDAILRRGDFRYLGLIGSATKLARFRKRLGEAGHDSHAIGRITCPIGIAGIDGKRPEIIAVATAAELLSLPEFEKMPRQNPKAEAKAG